VHDDDLLGVLSRAAEAVAGALAELDDWGPAGTRPGQYRLDLVADAAALEVLHGAGLRVLSEESGMTAPDGAVAPDPVTRPRAGGLLAVLDPVDGSTNAHRRIPYYATSVCILDDRGPRVGLVANLATGDRYEAVRGSGAARNGRPVRPSGASAVGRSVVGISGYPTRHLGWAQFRAFGAASLELCAVAEGVLDAYLQVGREHLYGWDYLAGLLVCREAGAVVCDADGQDLVVRDTTRRRPVAAATASLCEALLVAAGHEVAGRP
jgi:fructose-1,6-bisphosphatase/inositol monophosphatase family enzyme